jgi:hypothetical protein
MPHRHEHESEQKKIERIQRPAEKAGNERVALNVIKRLEKPDRFHRFGLIAPFTIGKRVVVAEALSALPGSGERTRLGCWRSRPREFTSQR